MRVLMWRLLMGLLGGLADCAGGLAWLFAWAASRVQRQADRVELEYLLAVVDKKIRARR